MIHSNMEIEELVRNYPFSVRYLMEKGIKCIACGEPIWGTLAEAAAEKGFNTHDITRFVDEMNRMANERTEDERSTVKREISQLDIDAL